MSVIEYTCDTCKRIIDIPQNKYGLEVIQKCIITDGCHGKLIQSDLKLDHIRGKFPNKSKILDDYIPRKILYNHKQSIKLQEWRIEHKLGISPLINVFIEKPKELENIENIDLTNSENLVELVEINPEYITIISGHELIIGFDRPEKGFVQLISKSSTKQPTIKPIDNSVNYFKLTNLSLLTIATLLDDEIIDIEFEYIDPIGNISSVIYNVDDNISINSPWSDYNKIYINNKTYVVRSLIIDTNITYGSSFNIKGINGLSLVENDLILLLSNSNYTTVDKVLNSFGNISSLSTENSINETLYNEGELFLNITNIVNVFPYIKKV